jgi:putative transposase
VHKHRNLLAHGPERLHGEISNDYRDMIYAESGPRTRSREEFKRRIKTQTVLPCAETAAMLF